jgi:SAM-dependent methyltransferase
MKKFTQQNANEIVNFINNVIAKQEKEFSTIRSSFGKPITPDELSGVVGSFAQISREFAGNAHQLKMYHDWSISPTPEWFDHFIDQFYQTQNSVSLWMERGVYGVLALKRGGKLLELCCGDGYNTKVFYSPMVESVLAIDFDADAISHAQRYNQALNIDFRLADIRTDFPAGKFDNVVWDAAIEHFNEAEIATLMATIKGAMNPDSVLSGHTIVENAGGHKHLHQHEREFRSKEDLASFLTPHFASVKVFETIHPNRHNLYFYASDTAVPFDENWRGSLSVSNGKSLTR